MTPTPSDAQQVTRRWVIDFTAERKLPAGLSTERKKAMQKLAEDYPTGVFRYRFPLKAGGLSEWHYYEFYPSHGFGEGEVEFLCGLLADAERQKREAVERERGGLRDEVLFMRSKAIESRERAEAAETSLAKANARIAELEGDITELKRHAAACGLLYREDEHGAPYFIDSRNRAEVNIPVHHEAVE